MFDGLYYPRRFDAAFRPGTFHTEMSGYFDFHMVFGKPGFKPSISEMTTSQSSKSVLDHDPNVRP